MSDADSTQLQVALWCFAAVMWIIVLFPESVLVRALNSYFYAIKDIVANIVHGLVWFKRRAFGGGGRHRG